MGATNNMVDKRNKNDLGKDDDFVETLPNIKPLGSTQEPVTPVLYSDNIGTPPPTNNGTNGAKYADGLTDTGSTGAGLTGSVATGTEPPKMTYEEYINNSMEFAEERKKFADKQAELAKNRQMIDANSSYMRNKATYGENAEKMAQMGLSGGGYSDYINAQAYAQKRDDVQNANALYSQNLQQNEATYKEYIMSLNKELAQKYLEDERIEQQHTYEDGIRAEQSRETMYKGLFADVQDNPQNFTDEAIDKIAKEYGFSDEQTQSIKDMLKTSKENYVKNKGDNIFKTLIDGVNDINSGYTAEIISSICDEFNLSPQRKEMLINLLNAVKSKKEESIINNAKDIINANGGVMTDDVKDSLRDLGIEEETINKIEEETVGKMGDKYSNALDGYIVQDNTDAIEKTLLDMDAAYGRKEISKEKYIEIYNKAIENEIAKAKNRSYEQLGQTMSVIKDRINKWAKIEEMKPIIDKATKELDSIYTKKVPPKTQAEIIKEITPSVGDVAAKMTDGEFLKQGVEVMKDNFADGLKEDWNNIKQGVSDAANWVSNAAQDAGNWVANAGKDAVDWTKNAAKDAANWVSGAAKDVGKFFKGLFGG